MPLFELLPGSAWEQQWRRFVEQLTRDDRITYISLGGNLTTRSVIVVVSFRADFSKIQKNELILLLAETFGESVEEVTELPETPWAT